MNKKFIITENQLQLLVLKLEEKNSSFVNVDINECFGPISKLKECIFSPDRKYVLFENNGYDTTTGEYIPMNEGWLSNVFHIGLDLTSAAIDFVIPGSGAIVDTINALSYVIEAQFKSNEKEKDSLYLMAAITFAFVVLPGPLQTIAIPLKSALKGGKMSSSIVRTALPKIAPFLNKIFLGIPNLIGKALNSSMGKKVLGKYSSKIMGFIGKFIERIKALFKPILDLLKTKGAKVADKMAKSPAGVGVKELGKVAAEKGSKILSKLEKISLTNFFKRLPKIPQGTTFLRKMGFIENKTYRVMKSNGKMSTATIIGMKDKTVLLKWGKSPIQSKISVEEFTKRAIGAPWGRRGMTVAAPFFIKRFASIMSDDGSTIDDEKFNTMTPLDPDEVSSDSLNYVSEEETYN